jgi:pimeloyl-ACP methyl ester carboxylesterase
MIHGWGGNASDMAAFVAPLLKTGYEVIIPDLPGHGDSEGETVSVPNAAQALLELQKHTGPFHALVAHSVGTAAAVLAMREGLKVDRAVLIAPPARYSDYAAGFARQLGLSGAQTLEMIEVLRQLGHDVASVDSPAAARNLWQAALVVHSNDDRVVSADDGREIAAAWPASRIVLVDGLGHRRILEAPEVVAQVVSFIVP